ncbi:TFIIB-type zinc ribbon-containing protein [Aeromicrobium wangtongii]|uniref:Zf-TFIIB domain-containing protein n=1 Tax=Aeromicrobium wangtongii TaxID=2969247 RepID=A0ABY5MD75_9ACTN|nr:zf-TFIIB domain-containing protein [Aeromicrobium wangtongii]MCD9197186.1 zf-TFIIB domain-containing protein [Aeromicrobium wangtongii]UUP14682.1 zf-TFIIB domain-containing protein [Aeromicrobium wangtongii]
MKCPTDGATLVMSERSGIEIDYCPDCRGVWLDRGELDKIIDRAAADVPAAPRPTQVAEPYRDDRRRPEQMPYRRKKKDHWLSELFD